MKQYAINIKEWRESIGLTRAMLAKLIRVSQMSIWYWENGKYPPTVRHLRTLKSIAKSKKYGGIIIPPGHFSEE